MRTGSLRIRLLAAAALSILAALLFICFLLVGVFDQYVRERLEADLGHHLDQLAALAVPDAAAGLKIDGELTDPRFDQPLGGLYWQVDSGGHVLARSRSLWDARLDPGSAVPRANGVAVEEIAGPGGARLLSVSRMVTLGGSGGASFRLSVANDLSELESGRRGLFKTLAAGLGVSFFGLLIAFWLQVSFGLKPLDHIRLELQRIRGGETKRMDGARLPDEVRPLALEVNRFLDAHDDTSERARRRAGDLAHGLKTPLAALAAEADRLRREGESEAADTLLRHIASMRRNVERHLAMARSAGSRATVARASTGPVGPRLEAISALLQRLPHERAIAWSLSGDRALSAAMDPEDFDEVFGNLLDNARKWARSEIAITIERDGDELLITVADDGPGIPPEHLRSALERGTRLDERVHGSGLGLSIVEAVLENYGARLGFARAGHLGGLAANVRMTAA